ncbi:DUF4129 domain-containing protein [Dyella nitratireducens]|uniref:DUF4129 domain-containing protein n=1 Tax=Dyella nitratireducens TaxID=1849580 RepID=A0ABQ1G0F2_9GAMM|nr:DUF4129 domain-containing protein [Dyella nitratireducens]GGA34223.1 hypothetical protein GCM10010981_23990 [Dyella nitratireducens]GLQ40833.1 hypothetical protein GCM10007902_06830 [Dyella nitratireducens]
MQLERIGVALRPRTSQEAMDLGMAMLRAHARPVWSAWLVFTLPIFLACQLLAWVLGMPWLALVLPWWLRPLFDRIPLYVLSRAVFEQAPSWRETLKAQRTWPWGRTFAGLTWLRVDTNRSLRLPMELLEGMAAKQRRARWRVLSRPLVGAASGLTWICIAFELVISLSLCIFAMWLVPSEALPDSMRSLNQAFTIPAFRHALLWIASGAIYVSMSIVEPLYVAAGFGLYLNRRTQLEAWDIDLAFRRLRERLLEAGVGVALLICVLCLPSFAHAADTRADAAHASSQNIAEVFHQPVNDKDALFASEAAYVYRDARFGQPHKVQRWVPRIPTMDTRSNAVSPSWFGAMFANLGAGLLNVLLWGLLAIVVGALMVFALRYIRIKKLPLPEPGERPKPLRSSVMHDMPLPDDLAAAVRELWHGGRHREALALLYRGSVQRAATALRMQPPIDATESDWLHYARSVEDQARRERLIAIVRTWQFAAYADRYPGDADVDALLSGWPAQQVVP